MDIREVTGAAGSEAPVRNAACPRPRGEAAVAGAGGARAGVGATGPEGSARWQQDVVAVVHAGSGPSLGLDTE